jgi:uncharacterized membrane protein
VTRVRAGAHVPGTADQARALWFDLSRWPAFVDGFASVVRVDPGWPGTGEIVWDSTPHGRGRVVERRDGSFEDGRLTGTQEVRFRELEDGVAVSVELDYRLKERTPITPLVDYFFVRRSVREALERTLRRFAAEARFDSDLRRGATL